MKLVAFPAGWCLGYLVRDHDDDLEVGFLSIVGMEAHENGVCAIVATPTGALARDRDIEHPIICIAGPDDDRERVARAGCAEYMAKRTAKPAAPTSAKA